MDELESLAWENWDRKAKPQLSLGRLEHLVVDIVKIRGELYPSLNKIRLLLFCSDHGVVNQSVSSSPQEITWQQTLNFAAKGGAVGLLCEINSVDLEVIDVGVKYDFSEELPIVQRKIAYGTKDFTTEQAMSQDELIKALGVGKERVKQAKEEGYEALIFGEMGIGNTTSSSALMASLTNISVEMCTGKGAGLSEEALLHKKATISDALKLHNRPTTPLLALKTFGGFEIAAIVGGMIESSKYNLVILVDGFIATVAAYIAILVEPTCKANMIFCHQSEEGGHALLLKEMNESPLLSLSMRLGEGTGALVALPIIRQALELYNRMTSFSEAEVTDSVDLLKQQGVDFRE